jgi:hypothetical protein
MSQLPRLHTYSYPFADGEDNEPSGANKGRYHVVTEVECRCGKIHGYEFDFCPYLGTDLRDIKKDHQAHTEEYRQ